MQAAATDDGTVEADPTQYDSQYLEAVTIGSQQFKLDFDTGSADLYELPPSCYLSHQRHTNHAIKVGFLRRTASQ